MPENDLQLRVSQLGADATLNQIKALRKEVQGAYADTKAGTVEQRAYGETLNQLNSRVKELNPNFNAMRAHTRAARQESFMFRFAVTELLSPLSEFAGKNKELVQSLQGVVGVSLSVKYGLSMMGSTFASMSTPISIVIGGLAAYSLMTKNVEQNQLRLNTALDKQTELLYKLGKITDDEYLKYKNRRAEDQARSAKGNKPGFFELLWASISGSVTIGGGPLIGGAIAAATLSAAGETEIKNAALQSDLDKKAALEEANKHSLQTIKQVIDAGKLSFADLAMYHEMGYISDDVYSQAVSYKMRPTAAPVAGSSSLTGKRTNLISMAGVGPVSGVNNGSGLGGSAFQGASAITFSDVLTNSKIFETSFKTGMMSSAAVIDQYIGGAFRRVFGEGQNLLSAFAQGFISSFVNTGLSLASGGLWNLITGGVHAASGNYLIPEPVLGMGMHSGRPYSFGESGMEIAKMNSGYASASFAQKPSEPMNVHVTGTFRQHGADMLATVEHATLVRNSRSHSVSS